MKVHLPNSAFLGNIDPFLKSLDLSNPNELYVSANQDWISVHPMVIAMIAALSLRAGKGNIFCDEFSARSAPYFQRIGLYNFLGVKPRSKIVEHDSSGKFIPLTQIKNASQLTDFIKEMVPLLHLDKDHTESIRYIISELVRNVLEHSLSSDGALVMAQYYPKTKTIRLGIADAGIGVRRSIAVSHKAVNDMDGLQLALTPGITGTTSREGGTDQNAGAGLFFVKSIAKVSRDFFVIYSGDAMYKLLRESHASTKPIQLFADPFLDRNSRESGLPSWQGTVVGVDMSLETTSEFTALLDHIRTVYAASIRERRLGKYKKPRFIK